MKYTIQILLVCTLLLTACSKEPGVGGNATITGKVFTKHYNSTFTVLISSYYDADAYVYIQYGDDINYSDRIKTNYDGEYAFEFLYPGEYTIYTYSIDSAAIVNGLPDPPDSAMIQHVTVLDNKEIITLSDFVTYQ